MKITRRDTLRLFGAAGAAAALTGCRPGWQPADRDPTSRALAKPPVPGSDAWATNEERWIASSCAQCPASCGVRVRVVEGRAVRIEGNRKNPLNQGGIGPRGLAGLQALYDADRITGPLVRRGGHLVPATWAEALGIVSEKLAALRKQGAPDKLVVLSGSERGFVHELLARFCRAYGTPHFLEGSGSLEPLAQAMEACVGYHATPAFDWAGASYVLSLEAALVEGSCQAVHFSRATAQRRRGMPGRRLKLVHVGPMLDLAALNADEWIRIRPGTSGALALGLCHVLARDHGAIPEPRFAALLQSFTPEKVTEICGGRADDVERIAGELVDEGPSFALVDERSLAYTNGWHTALATLALNRLLGGVERAAGGLRIAPSAPLAAWADPVLDDTATAGLAHPRIDGAGAPAFPRARSVLEAVPQAIALGKPEVVLLHQANPTWARQQPSRWRQALAQVPLVVSFSPFRDETVESVAHVVLPDHTYLERWEDAIPAPTLPRAVVGVRRPAIEPLHDTRATGDVVLSLARGLGGAVADAFPWHDFREAMEQRLSGLRQSGRGNIVVRNDRAFLDRLFEEGFWADDEPAPLLVDFAFPAEYAPPEWRGDPQTFPFQLLAYRPVGHALGGGANQPWLHLLRDRPGAHTWTTAAALHPDTIPGVHDGDRLELKSQWGTIAVPARLDPLLERGLIAVPTGGGHTAMGRWARGVGANVMELLAPDPAPITGAPVLCGTRIAARKIGGRA